MFSTSPSIVSICSGVRFFIASAAAFICSWFIGPPGGGSMCATVRGAARGAEGPRPGTTSALALIIVTAKLQRRTMLAAVGFGEWRG